MTVIPLPDCRRLFTFVLPLALLPWGGAFAQSPGMSLVPQSQAAPPMPPSSSQRGTTPIYSITTPNGANVPPTAQAPLQLAPNPAPTKPQTLPHTRPGEVALVLGARFAGDMPINGGLTWRIYADRPE